MNGHAEHAIQLTLSLIGRSMRAYANGRLDACISNPRDIHTYSLRKDSAAGKAACNAVHWGYARLTWQMMAIYFSLTDNYEGKLPLGFGASWTYGFSEACLDRFMATGLQNTKDEMYRPFTNADTLAEMEVGRSPHFVFMVPKWLIRGARFSQGVLAWDADQVHLETEYLMLCNAILTAIVGTNAHQIYRQFSEQASFRFNAGLAVQRYFKLFPRLEVSVHFFRT